MEGEYGFKGKRDKVEEEMGVNVEMDNVEGENGLRRGIGTRWRGKRAKGEWWGGNGLRKGIGTRWRGKQA